MRDLPPAVRDAKAAKEREERRAEYARLKQLNRMNYDAKSLDTE
jgi:hypothetical protein